MKTDPASSTPKYRQIAEKLAADCAAEPGLLKHTQKDLAKRYGVHLLTLRRALDWLDRTGEMERLAGRLRPRTSGSAGPVIGCPVWAESLATLDVRRTESRLDLIQTIHAELVRFGYRLDVQFVGPEMQPDRGKIRELCEQWDGIILEPLRGEPSRITAAGHPFEPLMDRAVFIGVVQGRRHNCVSPDLYASGEMAIGEFARLGVRRILYTGRTDETVAQRILRLISAEDAAERYPGMEILHAGGGIHTAESYSAVKQFFLGGGRCDAILAHYAYTAIGALRALADLRIRVPEQVQLICNGTSPRFPFMTPRPTVVGADTNLLGQEIARMAVTLHNTPGQYPNVLIPVQLIQGDTTLPPSTHLAPAAPHSLKSFVQV